jgi:vacuolar protein sorting-associated protein 53
LFADVQQIQSTLKTQIFTDFSHAFVGSTFRGQPKPLHDACLILEERNELLGWYVSLQLKEYQEAFKPYLEVGGLADVGRRFAWLKRLLKVFDDEHSLAFPKDWRVDDVIVEEFCRITRYISLEIFIFYF